MHVALEFDLRPAGNLLVVRQVAQGGHDARLVEDRRPHAADQPPRFEMRLPHHLHARIVGGPGVPGRGPLGLLVGLELDHRGGQLLGQPVVDVVGDQLPFVIAGAEHVPERSSLPIDGFLGPRSLRVLFALADSLRPVPPCGPPRAFDPLHLHAAPEIGNQTLQKFHPPAVIRHANTLPDPPLSPRRCGCDRRFQTAAARRSPSARPRRRSTDRPDGSGAHEIARFWSRSPRRSRSAERTLD